MTARRFALLACLACAPGVTLASPAAGYPPITCGQLKSGRVTYVVRTHGPTCGFAVHGIKVFLKHHHGPRGFRCQGSSGSVLCRKPHGGRTPDRRNLYFQANPAR